MKDSYIIWKVSTRETLWAHPPHMVLGAPSCCFGFSSALSLTVGDATVLLLLVLQATTRSFTPAQSPMTRSLLP